MCTNEKNGAYGGFDPRPKFFGALTSLLPKALLMKLTSVPAKRMARKNHVFKMTYSVLSTSNWDPTMGSEPT